jgi:hypothetical protein
LFHPHDYLIEQKIGFREYLMRDVGGDILEDSGVLPDAFQPSASVGDRHRRTVDGNLSIRPGYPGNLLPDRQQIGEILII